MSKLPTADRLAIHELLADVSWRIDHGQVDRIGELFAEDGVVQVGDNILKGREAITRFIASAQPEGVVTRHAACNVRLRPRADGDVEGDVLLILAANRAGAGTFASADYRDLYTKGDDAVWRLRRREIVIATTMRVAEPA